MGNFSEQENDKYKYGCKSRNSHLCSQDLPAKTILLKLGAIQHARDRSACSAGSGRNLFGLRRAFPECSHVSELLFPKSKSFRQFQSINARKPLAVSVARGRMHILIHSSLSCSRLLPITPRSLPQSAFTIDHQPNINPSSPNGVCRGTPWPDHMVR
jgi:hypothetical protein